MNFYNKKLSNFSIFLIALKKVIESIFFLILFRRESIKQVMWSNNSPLQATVLKHI